MKIRSDNQTIRIITGEIENRDSSIPNDSVYDKFFDKMGTNKNGNSLQNSEINETQMEKHGVDEILKAEADNNYPQN